MPLLYKEPIMDNHNPLTQAEARVLAALFEKSLTTPQYYPLTTNALVQASNQKNARNPVMALSEAEVGAALNSLELRELVRRDDSSARAIKWKQRLRIAWGLDANESGVLVATTLRGPQTKSELKTNSENLGGPASAEELDRAIDMLKRSSPPRLLELEKIAGQKEIRFVSLVCGEDAVAELVAAAAESSSRASRSNNNDELIERIAALELRVEQLEKALN
jgi:uncharacterized protein YceH (UPF0502 family)